jgi:outer membrane immunogenic protein
LFAGAIALVAATPAFAADLPQAGPPPPQAPAFIPPPPVYNWGGVYIGVNGGYGFGNSNWGAPISTGNFNINGGLIGGTLGVNAQTGQFVFGLEGDVDWANLSGSVTCAGLTCQTSNDWLSTFRGRVGYAFNRVLLYGTAGGAVGDVKATFSGASADNTEFGWTAGAGLEFAITDNITAKAEYLFVDLSSGSCSTAVCTAAATAVPVSFDTSLIRAGLNFKFNPW